MTVQEERRAAGIGRVPVQTLVELCGIDPATTPAFEGESLDVSGRGMHVRTAYLPPEGTQLVCRFEERGQEIIAEGVVAWRSEQGRGGEFGLMFTALDSGSVEALRQLTGLQLGVDAEPPEDPQAADDGAEEPTKLEAGARVRLHIDGLGAPMKALVKQGSRSRLKVGSNLEFLRVGRKLAIEDLGAGERRVAEIDGIDVIVEPQSGVPQLVVALHYDDVEDVTPEPSVIDEPAPRQARSGPRPAAVRGELRSSMGPSGAPKIASAPASTSHDEEPDLAGDFEPEPFPEPEGEELDREEDAPDLRGRAEAAATRAGLVAKEAGAKLASLGSGAAQGLGVLVKSLKEKVAEAREKRGQPKPTRRTAPPPAGALASDGRRLRPQGAPLRSQSKPSGPSEPAAERSKPALSLPFGKKGRSLAAMGAGAALVGTVTLIALNRPTSPPGAEGDPTQSVTVAAQGGDPSGAKRQAAVERLKDPPPAGSALTADVPLFGPTPMATLEPAPLEAPPVPSGALPELQSAPEDDGVAAAKFAPVPDEVFEQPSAAPAGPKPEDVKPWGRGKVNTPTLHRLRLDGAGTAIQGAVTATGFSVVIPERKVMETGEGIAKRDKRIARVSTKNSGKGAQITFSFKEGVPGYRVRLRRDFVEFLVSAPDKK